MEEDQPTTGVLPKINGWLRQRFQSSSKWIGKYWPFLLAVIISLILLGSVWIAYLHWGKGYIWADWTGLGEYTGPHTKDQRSKTLWDWLELLIIPAIIALAAIFFNRQEKQNELKIADDRNQEAALQNYLDKMNQLILERGLREPKSVRKMLLDPNLKVEQEQNDLFAVRDMAQVRTTTVLRQLNVDRRNIVLEFLRDTGLTDFILSSANMHGVDLKGTNLMGANLRGADLRGANLRGANLVGAVLNKANLSRASMTGANLSVAKLSEANLTWANLSRANLIEAKLIKASLFEAKLIKASLFGDDLSDAEPISADLRGANLIGIKLIRANLSRANLRGADLREVDLNCANLNWADLRRANLSGANLIKASLFEAKLIKAILTGANLTGANLTGANLRGANLRGTDLSGADLDGADLRWVLISDEQLASAKSLKGTTMPDGKKYDPTIHHF